MQIQEFRGKAGRVRYDLLNDNGGFVARFDSLDDVARVVRYVNGGDMSAGEVEQVTNALQCANISRLLGRTLNAARQAKRAAKATGGAVLGGGDLDAGG